MANSFENFDGSSIDTIPEQESREVVSSPYERAMLEKTSLEGQMLDLRTQIQKAEAHDDDKEVERLENLLRVAEGDLEEAKESIAIEENKMQEVARARRDAEIREKDQDEAIRINKNVDRMSDWKEAIRTDAEIDAYKEIEDHKEANRVNENVDRMTDKNEALKMDAEFVRDEAENINEKLDTYAEAKASAERSLAYYAQASRKIERQRVVVASMDDKIAQSTLDVARLRAEIHAEEKRDGKDVHENVNRLEALLHEAEQVPAQKAAEIATLANMEKVFPAQEADAKKFVEQYFGKSAGEYQAAVELYSLEVKKADDIGSLMQVIERWGGIPEGNKFVTNTKFRQDLETILTITSEDEKVAELETVTRNDEVCEKLLELYRKERDEALTEVTEEVPKKPVSLAMRQPNIETRKEDAVDPALKQEFMKVRLEEKDIVDLIETVSSRRFKLFPFSFNASREGRKHLKMLHDMDIPMSTRYEREGAALIALSLRHQEIKDRRQAFEKRMGIGPSTGLRDEDLRGTAVMDAGYTPPPQRRNWNKFGK